MIQVIVCVCVCWKGCQTRSTISIARPSSSLPIADDPSSSLKLPTLVPTITSARSRTRLSNLTHNAEVRSSIDYLTERLTTDEHVAPKTTLRVAVLRRRLRRRCRQHRGPRLAGGVAATGLLRAEPDSLFRHGAEGPTQEAEAVRSHRLRASRHDETGRWSARWVKPMYVSRSCTVVNEFFLTFISSLFPFLSLLLWDILSSADNFKLPICCFILG